MLKYRLKNALLFSLVVLAVVSACHKDNVSSKPSLLSFGPSTVDHGDTIKFIGTNLNQITDIVMPVGIDVPSSSFITHTSTLIELVVPELSMMGHVVLRYGNDSIVSKGLFGAEYTITVRSFTPASLRPGDNITINGNFLNYVKQVSFNAGQNVTQFVSQSLHQLVVQVPLAAQTGPFTLTDLTTTNAQVVTQDTLLNDLILTVALPMATGVSPANGVEQTKNVTLTGTDLDLVTEIDFPSASGIEQKASGVTVTSPVTAQVPSTAFVSQTATQIVVAVPDTAVTGALTLVAPSGLKTTSPSVTVLEPTVTTMSTGKVGVDNVTISGTSLDLVKSITFPGSSSTAVASSSFVSQSATEIVVAIPALAIPGNLALTTTTDFPVVIDGYTITLPEATAYSSTTAGQPTTITGTDLDLVASMKFPDGTVVQQSDFTAQSATSITVDVPSSSTSVGTLIFTIANGYNVPQTLGFGGCSTSFPGTLLFDFADASQATSWGNGGNPPTNYTTSDWDNTDGHTCNGEFTADVSLLTGGTSIQYNIGNVDWTGKSKLHMWIKIDVADIATINGGQIYCQPGGWSWNANWFNASPTFDGGWHEVTIDLTSISTLTPMNAIGVQLQSKTDGIQATVHIDDVWVE